MQKSAQLSTHYRIYFSDSDVTQKKGGRSDKVKPHLHEKVFFSNKKTTLNTLFAIKCNFTILSLLNDHAYPYLTFFFHKVRLIMIYDWNIPF